MFKQTLKKMVLTGAMVMVLMSTAAPAAIAAPAMLYEQQSDVGDVGVVIPACAIYPWLCQ